MSLDLIIMCKAPVAGRVKTRLIGSYSAREAAALHASMAEAVICRAKRLFNHVVIAADDPGHLFFRQFGLPLVGQGEGDLGARMQRLMLQSFANGAGAVMILGTDSPHMQEERLLAGKRLLDDYDVVLGPVEDGGYDLIALNGPHSLFEGVSWSSDRVLGETLKRANDLNLRCFQLPMAFDLDRPEDLRRAGWSPG